MSLNLSEKIEKDEKIASLLKELKHLMATYQEYKQYMENVVKIIKEENTTSLKILNDKSNTQEELLHRLKAENDDNQYRLERISIELAESNKKLIEVEGKAKDDLFEMEKLVVLKWNEKMDDISAHFETSM